MSLKIRDRDYVPDGAGGFQQAEGTEELLEQVLFQLTAHRGAFSLMPEVGSRLYTLYREKPAARQTLAGRYAIEALADMEVGVSSVTVSGEDPIFVELELKYNGTDMNLEVAVT